MIASALTASGYTTGLYTSPHLHTFKERIRVDDKLISNEELAALVEKLKPEVEAVNEKATYGRLTTFELITALGLAYFKLKGVDFTVFAACSPSPFLTCSIVASISVCSVGKKVSSSKTPNLP